GTAGRPVDAARRLQRVVPRRERAVAHPRRRAALRLRLARLRARLCLRVPGVLRGRQPLHLCRTLLTTVYAFFGSNVLSSKPNDRPPRRSPFLSCAAHYAALHTRLQWAI